MLQQGVVAQSAKTLILAVGVVGALLFGLSGCVQAAETNNSTDTPVSEVPTHAEAEAPSSEEEPATACSGGDYGSVLPGEFIEDEHGTYCSVVVAPEALEYDPSSVDLAALEAAGFTEEDARVMWVDSMTFVAEEVIDSRFLERKKTPELAEEIWESYLDRIDTDHMTPGERINEAVVTGLPVLVRDGAPRLMHADMYMYEITIYEGNPTAQVRGLITYRVNPETAREFVEEQLGHEVSSPKYHLPYYPETDTYGVQLNMGYTVAYSRTDEGFKFGGAGWIYEFEVFPAG